MPVNYSIAMLVNPRDKDSSPKAYAKAQINGEMTLKTLSEEVGNKCTVHKADVAAVLIAAVETMLKALKEGKQWSISKSRKRIVLTRISLLQAKPQSISV